MSYKRARSEASLDEEYATCGYDFVKSSIDKRYKVLGNMMAALHESEHRLLDLSVARQEYNEANKDFDEMFEDGVGKRTMLKVEKAKRALSSTMQTKLEIEALIDGKDFSETSSHYAEIRALFRNL